MQICALKKGEKYFPATKGLCEGDTTQINTILTLKGWCRKNIVVRMVRLCYTYIGLQSLPSAMPLSGPICAHCSNLFCCYCCSFNFINNTTPSSHKPKNLRSLWFPRQKSQKYYQWPDLSVFNGSYGLGPTAIGPCLVVFPHVLFNSHTHNHINCIL